MKKYVTGFFLSLALAFSFGNSPISFGAIANIIHEGDSNATLPAGNSVLARTDAAQTFTGIQTFSSTISGNIDGSSASLATPRTINGVSFNGSANIISALYAKVASNVTRTAQTLADVTGLSVALSAATTYEFEGVLSVKSTDANGNEYGVNYSVGTATIEASIIGTRAATQTACYRISAANTATPAMMIANADGGVRIHGIITTGPSAGNLTISHLKVTSGTSTVYANSFLRASKAF